MKDYLLAASHGLQLISFPDFKPILKFGHDRIDYAECFNLDAYGNVAFLKSSDNCFKLIELVHSDSKAGKFRTVQEFEIPKAVCCACPKSQLSPTMAFGLSDGSILLAHYETQQKIAVLNSKSKEDAVSSSKYLDFSADHSQLVSVSAGGFIDVFDIRRNEPAFEMKQFKRDKPTLAKFNPTITPHFMCIGFESGKLKLYDTCVQKVIHKSKENHFSLCKDLCFFNTKPSTIISVGYDSSVLIHDFRSSTLPSLNFVSDHHLNAVEISADDNYYCVGDYKGNLMAYDIRKSHCTPLNTTKISDRIVKKILFMQSSAQEFYDDIVEPNPHHSIRQMSIKPDAIDFTGDSFFNFDVTKNDDQPAQVNCKNTAKDEDLAELKCENQFVQDIKSRSTCLFEQQNKRSMETPIDRVIKLSVSDSEPNTSTSEVLNIMARIERYEAQFNEMKLKISGLQSTVVEMNNFIGTFPKILQGEINNLIRKFKQSDMLLVEKLSMMCASDPQIVELTNFLLNRRFS